METLRQYRGLRIPTWALSYIINADSSGITEEDKAMVDDYLDKMNQIAGKYLGHILFDIETNEEDFLEAEDLLADEINDVLRDKDNYLTFQDVGVLRRLDEVVRLQSVKNEWKEHYFSWKPEFSGLGSDVQECTIMIVR